MVSGDDVPDEEDEGDDDDDADAVLAEEEEAYRELRYLMIHACTTGRSTYST